MSTAASSPVLSPAPIPVMLDIEDNVEWFQANPSSVTSENVEQALNRVGRLNGPALIFDLRLGRIIGTEILARLIGGVWSGAEYPDQAIPLDTWLTFFSEAGYTVDGQPAERPSEPIQLYRGTVPARRRDMSWTDSIETATTFAYGGLRGRPEGRVYCASVEPWRLLARNNDRTESEYVVNTHDLVVSEVER